MNIDSVAYDFAEILNRESSLEDDTDISLCLISSICCFKFQSKWLSLVHKKLKEPHFIQLITSNYHELDLSSDLTNPKSMLLKDQKASNFMDRLLTLLVEVQQKQPVGTFSLQKGNKNWYPILNTGFINYITTRENGDMLYVSSYESEDGLQTPSNSDHFKSKI